MCSEYQTQISHPLRFASFVKACRRMATGEGPHEPLITSLSKFRGPPELCEVRRRVLYKICKKCISRARAPRGRDAWASLIDIKSDSTRLVAHFYIFFGIEKKGNIQ
jgi:hypothetical protein